MLIENSINEKYIRTLNFGCFPANVLEFQESQDFLQQLIFIDYQLQLLIQNEFKGKDLVPAKYYELQGNDSPLEKLFQLISYAKSITVNYNNTTKTYDENLYFSVIMAHLYYLNSQLDAMHYSLNSIAVSTQTAYASATICQNEFIQYLTARYHTLLGLTSVENSYKVWIEYLFYFSKPFNKSQISANRWLDLLFLKLAETLAEGGKKLSFNDLKSQKFFDTKLSTIRYACFLLRPENLKLVDASFKANFAGYLSTELTAMIAIKSEFPNANNTDSELNDYVDNLYQSLSQVPFNFTVLKLTSTKNFLINATTKTYQSQTVLANLIKNLIDTDEYDEAFAAFKTYIKYLENDQELHGGRVDNILQVIEVFGSCIEHFNPIKSFAPRTNSIKKFKYTSEVKVVAALLSFGNQLQIYLNNLASYIDLNYDEEKSMDSANYLSFLYHKYNVNILLSDHSEFIELISHAWFSLGYYYYYLSIYESPTQEALTANTTQILHLYKNSLIVNSTGNVTYLFNYALALAFNKQLKQSLKLCKFILKKYPESFKAWNLLVLLLTSFETNDPDYTKVIKPSKPPIHAQNGVANGVANGQLAATVRESEKFINNALNIAGLFIDKHHQKDIKLTTEVKYEILQLKLTQMAVWESIYGVQYILEYLSEVFILYHELFDIEVDTTPASNGIVPGVSAETKWSHRPSFIDPIPVAVNGGSNGHAKGLSKEAQIARDAIKKLSKSSSKKDIKVSAPSATLDNVVERKILQEVWLWTSKVYLKIGLLEECEQCIVEAESSYEPNVQTFTALGSLTSKSRKFLSLQEFERSLEVLNTLPYNRLDYGNTLVGLCKLFIVDDQKDNSLFISAKDLNAGLIRLKNLLEKYTLSWPYGSNNVEIWYYLSKIYETIDDKILLTDSLWKCIHLEDYRPVRGFEICNEYNY